MWLFLISNVIFKSGWGTLRPRARIIIKTCITCVSILQIFKSSLTVT